MVRFWTLLVLCLALLAGAIILGWLIPLLEQDRTRITYAILALFALGQFCLGRKVWRWADHITEALPTIGLLGTIIGLKIAVDGSAGGDYELRDLGVATALNTTIAGVVGSLWLAATKRLLK